MEFKPDQSISNQSEQVEEERDPISELSKTLGEVDNVINDLTSANLTPEQKSRLRTIRKKVIKSTKRFLAVTGTVLYLGSILATTNYDFQHQDLEQRVDESGETTYLHKDKLTTHYLNILAGRDRFTEDDLATMSRGYYEARFKEKGIRPPKDIKEMSYLEMYTLYIKDLYDHALPPDYLKRSVEFDLDRFNDQIISRPLNKDNYWDKHIYNLVWQLENESGNPRIRLETGGILNKLYVSQRQEFTRYDPVSNTLYIDAWWLPTVAEGVFAEISHAKQFSDNPIGSYLKYARDMAGVVIRGKFDMASMGQEYDQLYKKPGSIEYEAHRVIEPYLKKKYPFIEQNDIPSK